jgi:hypothetical protein
MSGMLVSSSAAITGGAEVLAELASMLVEVCCSP